MLFEASWILEVELGSSPRTLKVGHGGAPTAVPLVPALRFCLETVRADRRRRGTGLEDAFEEQDGAGDHEDRGQRETEGDHGRWGPYPFIPVEATLWT